MPHNERSKNASHASFWRGLLRDVRKIWVFALSGALGCLVAAGIGELWLRGTHSPGARVPDYTICLLLDTSGSMRGPKLQEMKRAAVEFVRGRDLTHDRIAVVGFGGAATTVAPLSRDASLLAGAIEQLNVEGSTNMGAGLRTAAAIVGSTEGKKNHPPVHRRRAR